MTEAITGALGMDDIDEVNLKSILKEITICRNNILELHFHDGETQVIKWKQKSRSESWTKEMKEAAARKTAERHRRNKNGSSKKD